MHFKFFIEAKCCTFISLNDRTNKLNADIIMSMYVRIKNVNWLIEKNFIMNFQNLQKCREKHSVDTSWNISLEKR
jgi:hypothetical protein